MIYLDNAATSWPKPPQVLKAMADVLEYAGGNPGRSGHKLSISAARVVYQTREKVASLFHIDDPLRVVFASNATHAINIALAGLLKPGDHVVTSSIEHNAVMRPLRSLEKRGLRLEVVSCAPDGSIDVNNVAEVVNNETRLVIINHASNVVGTILPVAEIASVAHQAGALLLVDAAQTAGVVPIDIETMGIDLLAFTGHKGLLGPMGIGGLIIGNKVDAAQIEPLMRGGTGSQSALEEQPDYLPDKFESGTPNVLGIAGLGAGVDWLTERGIEAIRNHEKKLTSLLVEGLGNVPNIKVHGTMDANRSAAIVSVTSIDKAVSDIGLRLDEEFGILCRVGLHCAPSAHKTVGTFPGGTVRLAPGVFTSRGDINTTIAALQKVIR